MSEKIDPNLLIDFLHNVEGLKSTTRHSWTSSGRHESVAEHCWRLSLFALLLSDTFEELDINRVLKMCLIHDLGELIPGDIPGFLKSESDEEEENSSFQEIVSILPEKLTIFFLELKSEFDLCETPEAKLSNALDKIEAVLQHNEASIETWIDLEYELNKSYGEENCNYNPYLKKLREIIKFETIQKITLMK